MDMNTQEQLTIDQNTAAVELLVTYIKTRDNILETSKYKDIAETVKITCLLKVEHLQQNIEDLMKQISTQQFNY
jgi:hypothetical protein